MNDLIILSPVFNLLDFDQIVNLT